MPIIRRILGTAGRSGTPSLTATWRASVESSTLLTNTLSCLSAASLWSCAPLACSPVMSTSSLYCAHVVQRRFAQTLKDIEKHGAKGTSKLLRDLFPEIAMEVNTSNENTPLPSNVANTPATSGAVDLDTILFDSGRRVSWRCKQCSYTWVASVVSRTILKRGCPSCHRRDNPLLAEVNPRLLQELHPSKNTIFCEPEALEVTDRQRLWWLCGGCSSSFQARVCDRVQGKAPCPDCDRGHFSDFKVKKILLEEFHPTRNGDLTLAKLRPTDRVDVWWLCHACGHEFVCPLSVRVTSTLKLGSRTGSGYGSCPKCVARNSGMKEASKTRSSKNSGNDHIEAEGGVEGAKKKRGRKSSKKQQVGDDNGGVAIPGFTVDL